MRGGRSRREVGGHDRSCRDSPARSEKKEKKTLVTSGSRPAETSPSPKEVVPPSLPAQITDVLFHPRRPLALCCKAG